MKKIIINPLTRISGFMEIEVFVEKNIIKDAKTKGDLFRGFEQILIGRNPLDAVYFTQRICGICSTAHSMASSLALESALGITPSEQGRYLRDIIHGSEFLQNHIRHFYQYTLPDYVKMDRVHFLDTGDHIDYRLPENLNKELEQHYFDSLKYSRLAHEMLSVFGGKAPHNHGVFIGGITAIPTTDKLIKIKSIVKEISDFIENVMLKDVYIISKYYPDYFDVGKGFGNLLSFGSFNNYKDLGTLYVDPLVYTDGQLERFDPDKLSERIDYAYFVGENKEYKPFDVLPEPNMDKKGAYSFVKAPRYNDKPYEVGPLARLFLAGEYTNGISTMDRTIARALEAKKIINIISTLLDHVEPNIDTQSKYRVPKTAEGVGLVDTTRGALGHWLKIENGAISFYQIITPSAWDFSTRDDLYRGTAEQSLIGMRIIDPATPAEVGRTLRSFDPCISCATHVYSENNTTATIKLL